MRFLLSSILPKVSIFLAVFLATLLSLGAPSVSDDFSDRRITAGAKIFRALLAADVDIASKTDKTGKLRLCLVYENDSRNAQLAAETLHIREDTRIRKKEIYVEFISSSALTEDSNKTVAGMFVTQRLSDDKITHLVNFSKNHHVIIFSPFKGDVERGVLGGIAVEAQVKPYLNMEYLKDADVRLKSFFLRVAKKYEN